MWQEHIFQVPRSSQTAAESLPVKNKINVMHIFHIILKLSYKLRDRYKVIAAF